MWTKKFQMFKLDLEKAEEPDSKLPTSVRSQKKRIPEKTTTVSWTMLKLLTVGITTGKF